MFATITLTPSFQDLEAEGPDYHSHSKITACWRKCKKVLGKHDRSLVAGWKEDVDTLLVFVSVEFV